MVAVIDEVGYEGMSVGAVAARAGVSRGALYEYFDGGRACFLATFEALMDEGLTVVAQGYDDGDGPWNVRLERALDAMFRLLVAQPAAARLCFLETYAAGVAAAELRDRGGDVLQTLVRDALDESPSRAQMPPDVIRALTGGVRTITQARLRRRHEHELPAMTPELMRWLATYERPDPPLREIRGRAPCDQGFVATTHRHRIFVALAKVVAEKGYGDTTVVDVVSTAGVSLSTFYENFEGKEAAFLAACDFGIDQAHAATRAAWDAAASEGWTAQVCAALQVMLAVLASEPEWTYMAMVEIFAAGARARARRDRTIELFTTLAQPTRAADPRPEDVGPVTIEAIGGGVYALMYHQIRKNGAERLPEILPVAAFTVLAPFIGSAAAARVV